MRTTILATLVAAAAACSLGACDVDDLVAPPPWKDNTASVSGAPAAQVDSSETISPECPAPHPEYCKPGYIRAIAEDISTVLCQHQAGCPFSSQPCVYGRAIGNPETVVLCLDE